MIKLSKTELKLIAECQENGSAHFFTRGDQNKRKHDAILRLRDKGLIRYTTDRCLVQRVSAYGRSYLNGCYSHYACYEVTLLAGRITPN